MRVFLIALFLSTFALAAPAPAPEPMQLEEVFQTTLKRSETIGEQNELVEQSYQRYKQAVGSLFPTIAGNASYLKQQANSTSPVSPTDQPLVRLTAAQPLFRGLREFAAKAQMDYLNSAQKEQYNNAVRALFLDVSENFYTILSLEQDLRNLRTQVEADDDRIKELKGRINIGRSRLSEVLTVQAQQSSLRALISQTEGQLAAAKEVFVYLTGITSPKKLIDSTPAKPPEPVDIYLTKYSDRPDIKASEFQVEAAKKNVSVQWGAHLPSIDVVGNYYLKRFGINDSVKWDVQALVSVPIFSGGTISSRVSEASSQQIQAEYVAQRTKRAAEQQIRSLHAALEYDFLQMRDLEDAERISRNNLETLKREYRNGLVTNLDVLQGLTQHDEAQRSLDRIKFVSKLDYLKLDVASERYIPAQRK